MSTDSQEEEEEEWRGVQLAAGKDLPYALIAALTAAGALLTGYLTTVHPLPALPLSQ